ncbi:MAG: hypothetical protein K9M54_05275 [Kiritimatiellales bacterium]|nr:hypothetical protein [Kiritimatiellales bacterium]
MKPSALKTKLQSSTQLRKVVFGRSLDSAKPPEPTMFTRHVILGGMIACGIFSAGLPSASAATAAEGFDYTAGSAIGGLNGGSGWGGAWTFVTAATTNSAIGAGSLTYPNITSSGNKMISVATGNGDSRALRSFATGYSSGSMYASVLVQNLNDSVRYFGLSLYSGGTEQMLMGAGSGFYDWTVNRIATNGMSVITDLPVSGAGGLYANGALDSGIDTSALALLLVKVDFNAGIGGTNELITFWVNPDLSQVENVADAIGGQSYSTDRDFGTIDRVRIGGGADSGTYGVAALLYMDEINISSVSPFAPPPTLSQSVSGGDITLSWPAGNLGWHLQQTTNLVGGTWMDVPDSSLVTATNLPISLPAEFFRLRNP